MPFQPKNKVTTSLSFSPTERSILRTLYSYRRSMSINEISEKSGLSWSTVKKGLIRLNKRGYVYILGQNRNYFEFNWEKA